MGRDKDESLPFQKALVLLYHLVWLMKVAEQR
jgi:hypothetical protein